MSGVKDFLGVGIGFPWQLSNGKVAWAEYEESIRQAILMILGTFKGERLMQPEFGSDLPKLVFAPMDQSTFTQACYFVEDALKKWEPRIHLTKVEAKPAAGKENILEISIEYSIISTNNSYNLVYPFYIRPEK